MAKKSNKSSDKVNDVSKPGETPASSNARPTITGHSPYIKNDPMVAPLEDDKDEKTDKDDKKPSYLKRSKIKITPIADDDDLDEEESSKNGQDQESKPKETPKESEEAPKEGKPEEAKVADSKSEADETDSETESQPKDSTSDSAAIDALAKTADSKKAESRQAEEDKKHEEFIDGLAKGGKYRLPIIEGGHKASAERVVSWVFLFLLIASIGVYLAVDAGYIQIGFDLPFEFIKN